MIRRTLPIAWGWAANRYRSLFRLSSDSVHETLATQDRGDRLVHRVIARRYVATNTRSTYSTRDSMSGDISLPPGLRAVTRRYAAHVQVARDTEAEQIGWRHGIRRQLNHTAEIRPAHSSSLAASPSVRREREAIHRNNE